MVGVVDGMQVNEQGVLGPRQRRFALVVTSHRGDLYLPESIETWKQNLPWDRIGWKVLVDDGDTSVAEGEFDVAIRNPQQRGLAAAVQTGWSFALNHDTGAYVFHLEEDFHLLEPVDLDAMADTLDTFGNLSQLVLKRQPWSPEEQRAGGIVERCPDQYVEVNLDGNLWTQHHQIFSLNPCLIPARVIRGGWPASNEAGMTARVTEQGGCFGFWGGKFDPPKCLHVGSEGGMGSAGWAA